MAWKNYGWAYTVRGVEPHERNILFYLANAADEAGFIDSLRVSKLCTDAEITRRRLFQILESLEKKKFIERSSKVWNKALHQTVRIDKAKRQDHYKVVPKNGGKQTPTAYRIRKDRLFPPSENNLTWSQLVTKLEASGAYEPVVFRCYILSIKETCYVKRTSTLHLLASDADHKRWLDRELVKRGVLLGVDMKPPILVIRVFAVPSIQED